MLSRLQFGGSQTCLSRAIYQLSSRSRSIYFTPPPTSKRLEDVPGPRRLPFSNHYLFGPLAKLSDSYLPLPELYQKYGRIVKTQVFKEWMVTVFDSSDAKKIMQLPLEEADRPEMILLKEARQSLTQHYGSCLGISLSTGPDYTDLMARLQLQDAYKNMDIHTCHMEQQKRAEKLVGLMELNRYFSGEIDAKKLASLISKWSVEANGYFFLSSSVGTLSKAFSEQTEADSFVKAVTEAMDSISGIERGPFYWVMNKNLSPHYRKLVRAQNEAARITTMYYQREKGHIHQRKLSGEKSSENVPKLLESWMNNGVRNHEILAVFIDFMGAGVKTTATGVYSTLEFLGQNQGKQDEVVKKLKEGSTKMDGSKYQPAANAFREAVRMKPVFPKVLRRTNNEISVGGYRLPTGTLVQVPLEFLCTDPKYITDPRLYKPERWSNITENGNLTDDLLFGGGVRTCPCKFLTMVSAEVVIAEILKRFRIETREYEYEDVKGSLVRRRQLTKKLIFHDREHLVDTARS